MIIAEYLIEQFEIDREGYLRAVIKNEYTQPQTERHQYKVVGIDMNGEMIIIDIINPTHNNL